jgi:hypothetical protein
MADESIVWVLGAGFSRALGGPLLRDLFSWGSENDIAARFFPLFRGPQPDQAAANRAAAGAARVRWLYEYGLGPDRPLSSRQRCPVPGERLWTNAEEYLEYLDTAAETDGSPAALRLEMIQNSTSDDLQKNWPALTGIAKQIFAAECSGFLVGQTTALERWRPYVRWATQIVRPQDSIVSFNVDGVLELMGSAHPVETNHWSVLLPNLPAIEKANAAAVAPILKLHGSVDWVLNGDDVARHRDAHYAVTVADGASIVLGTPGPGKLKITKLLEPLWKRAEDAFRKARAVVFLGYRFPPTDAAAKERLLHAIGANSSCIARVILGDDIFSASRVRALIGYATRMTGQGARTSVAVEPLFVEDFLSVCSRDAILSPPDDLVKVRGATGRPSG